MPWSVTASHSCGSAPATRMIASSARSARDSGAAGEASGIIAAGLFRDRARLEVVCGEPLARGFGRRRIAERPGDDPVQHIITVLDAADFHRTDVQVGDFLAQ